MNRLLAVLLLVALPAGAAQTADCGTLCGGWQLDVALSTAVAPAVDEALRTYSEPRSRRPPRSMRSREGFPEDTIDQMETEMVQSLGPILSRPRRADLRSELMTLLAIPAQLNLGARGTDLTIQGDSQPVRRVSPGTPRARVDVNGTAKILASWKSNRLRITEKYDGRRQYFETYALQAADGTLVVTREVQRPGLKTLRIQSVYRRS